MEGLRWLSSAAPDASQPLRHATPDDDELLDAYSRAVIAAVEAACDEAFDLHGVSATTNAPSPLVIVNGPIRARLEINSGAGVFGSGWRANATIGRAVRLVCLNLGGARPGVVSMSTLAHPGRYTYCIGEHEEASPWESLAVEHGFGPDQSTVAALAADAPLGVYAQRSRTPEDLLPTLLELLGLPAPRSLFESATTTVASIGLIARAIKESGPHATIHEIFGTLPALTSIGVGAAVLGNVATFVGAGLATFYLAACIGSLLVATGQTLAINNYLAVADEHRLPGLWMMPAFAETSARMLAQKR